MKILNNYNYRQPTYKSVQIHQSFKGLPTYDKIKLAKTPYEISSMIPESVVSIINKIKTTGKGTVKKIFDKNGHLIKTIARNNTMSISVLYNPETGEPTKDFRHILRNARPNEVLIMTTENRYDENGKMNCSILRKSDGEIDTLFYNTKGKVDQIEHFLRKKGIVEKEYYAYQKSKYQLTKEEWTDLKDGYTRIDEYDDDNLNTTKMETYNNIGSLSHNHNFSLFYNYPQRELTEEQDGNTTVISDCNRDLNCVNTTWLYENYPCCNGKINKSYRTMSQFHSENFPQHRITYTDLGKHASESVICGSDKILRTLYDKDGKLITLEINNKVVNPNVLGGEIIA